MCNIYIILNTMQHLEVPKQAFYKIRSLFFIFPSNSKSLNIKSMFALGIIILHLLILQSVSCCFFINIPAFWNVWLHVMIVNKYQIYCIKTTKRQCRIYLPIFILDIVLKTSAVQWEWYFDVLQQYQWQLQTNSLAFAFKTSE